MGEMMKDSTDDPATDDDVTELVDRIVRRAQYAAVLVRLSLAPVPECDVRELVNRAARELDVPPPYRSIGGDGS
jgi:hypothetical protein